MFSSCYPHRGGSLLRTASVAILPVLLAGCGAIDWKAEREANIPADLAFAQHAPVFDDATPLGLPQAVDYALAHNLDKALLERQREYQIETRTGARLGMLPSLLASGSINRRDQFRASTSESLETGNVSLEPSYSSEKKTRTADLRLAWSLLDFGVSFVRARQEDKHVLRLTQQLRRTRQNLALNVTQAWYRAVLSDKALQEAAALLDEATRRIETIRKQVRQKTLSEMKGLDSEETLVLMRMRLQEFERQRRTAHAELASLMGVPPDTPFSFPPHAFDSLEEADFDLAALEDEALRNRPELSEKDLEASISTDAVRLAVLGMLPNPTASVTRATDRNTFLAFTTWWEAGVQIAWDLLSIPARAADMRAARAQRDFVEQQRMAIAAGILVQTHLAVINYEDARSQWLLANELHSVRARRMEALRKRFEQGEADAGMLLDAEANAFFSRIEAMGAYADAMVAKQRIENTVGRDPAARARPVAEILVETADPLASGAPHMHNGQDGPAASR